jgi:hypothetical protein
MTDNTAASGLQRLLKSVSRVYQVYMDRAVMHPISRWMVFSTLLLVYLVRVYLLNGFFIVTYGLGIYMLNLFIGFLSPAVDPEEMDSLGGEPGPVLPTRESDEFRPFTRKLPEFQFWFWGTRAVVTSLMMTFFSVFDLPVFWPILLIYFIFLFLLTMKQQILHMLKYRYVPWSSSKRQYTRPSI